MIKLKNLFHKKFESEHVARIESDEHVQKVDINEVVSMIFENVPKIFKHKP